MKGLEIYLIVGSLIILAAGGLLLWLSLRRPKPCIQTRSPQQLLAVIEAAVLSGTPEISVEAEMQTPTRWLNFPNGAVLMVYRDKGGWMRIELSTPEYFRLEQRPGGQLSYVILAGGIRLRYEENEMPEDGHPARVLAIFARLMPHISDI